MSVQTRELIDMGLCAECRKPIIVDVPSNVADTLIEQLADRALSFLRQKRRVLEWVCPECTSKHRDAGNHG